MKPQILIVHEVFGEEGGAESIVLSLAEKLSPLYSMNILSSRFGRVNSQWENAFQEKLVIPFHTISTDVLLHKINPFINCILVHKCTSRSALEALFAFNVPVLHWQHDHEIWCMRGYKYSPFTRKICHSKAGIRCLFPCCAFAKRDRKSWIPLRFESFLERKRLIDCDKKCTHHIVGSDFMKKEMERQGYEKERIHVVPYAPEKLYTSARTPDTKTILFAGQIVRGKGLDTLLQAAKSLTSPWELVVIGTGSHEKTCKKLVQQLGLEEKVHFTGYLPFEKMIPYYEKAVCLVMPSMWPEPFGLVGIEAMRLGVPVIGFDSGAISDWLHHEKTGFVVPWGDVSKLAYYIEKLLQNPSLVQKYGDAALEEAKQYNEKKIISCLSDILSIAMR